MKNKKRGIWGYIIVVILTIICTSLIQVTIGNKVIVSKDLYESYKKYDKLLALENIIQSDFYEDVSQENLIEAAQKGIFDGLEDPYSQYYDEAEFQILKEQTSGEFTGIGIYISPNKDDNSIVIISPIEGSPAEQSGIKSGDIILKVDGTSVTADESNKAISMIKGKEGTEVVLTIQRDKEQMDITVKRENIVIKSVSSEVMDDNIGYLKIKSFDENTYEEFKEEIANLKEQNVEGLVIDLRDNPGGLLDICVEVADDLLGEATIVYTKDNKDNTNYYKSDKEQLGLPIAVLINGGSASASEILTAALVDNDAAVAIGTTSFGKGLVQTVKGFKDGTGYKLTTAQYFTPNGDYINKKGITPSIEEEDEAKQLQSALDYLKNKIK